MLKINKGEPWLMWPDILVANFIDFPANKIFDHDGDFKFTIIFESDEIIEEKSTLFSKLPSYFGIDLEPSHVTLIFNEENKKVKYLRANVTITPNIKNEIKIIKRGMELSVHLNGDQIITHELIQNLKKNAESHIIFGSGNFPENNFNLNYFSFILHYLSVEKDGVLIAEHTFEKYIHNKSFDLTGNCNFIHKI